MAKRWTDTEKWKDDWYISLSNDYRIVWQWLIDNCTHAGFCKRSMGILNMMCKVSIKEEDMIDKMDNRVIIVGNEWFIPKFIKFQYATLLSAKPAILSVVKELFSKNCIHIIPESFGNDFIIKEKSFDNHYAMIKDKDKDKDKRITSGATISEVSNGVGQSATKFDEKGEKAYFADGTYQPLGMEQRIAFRQQTLKPRDVKKGASY